nr:MAG TPA: putative nucleic-acid-binding protein [Caudoviricetes sp.]
MTRCPMLARLQQALGIVYISGGGMCPESKNVRCRSCGRNWRNNWGAGENGGSRRRVLSSDGWFQRKGNIVCIFHLRIPRSRMGRKKC